MADGPNLPENSLLAAARKIGPIGPVIDGRFTGDALFRALVGEIERLRSLARETQDVLAFVGDVPIAEIRYFEPHTFAFRKLSDHPEWVEVCHFSQVSVQILIVNRAEPAAPRVVTGFWRDPAG